MTLHSSKNKINRIMDLQRVSTRWRDVVQEAAILWCTVEASATSRGLPLALEFSHDLPLHIVSNDSSLTTSDALKFVELVKPHSGRWKSLRWQGPNVRNIGLALSTCPTPLFY